MSKGPGRIERALAAIFDCERDNAFAVEDLAERIYPGYPDLQGEPVAKRHRVSIIRAARNLARRRQEIECVARGAWGRTALVFFRHDEVMSYAMSRLKADRFERYRNHDPRLDWTRDEADLRRRLADERHRELVGPRGAWRRHVDIFLAQRDGDTEKGARLEAEGEAALGSGMRSAFAKPR